MYLSSPNGPRHRYSNSSGPPPDRNSFSQYQNGKAPEPPRIGIRLEQDDGTLGIDFGGSSPGSGSDHGTDGSSELPWARKDQTGPYFLLSSLFSLAQLVAKKHVLIRPSTFLYVYIYLAAMPPSFSKDPEPSGLRIHQASAAGTRRLSDQPNSYLSSSRPYPLQLDTAALSPRSSVSNISPSSVLLDAVPSASSATTRRSLESSRTMPNKGPNGPRHERSSQDRSISMSATSRPLLDASTSVRSVQDSHRTARPPIPSKFEGGGHSPVPASRKTPIVYPALLSRVAEAFRDRIPTADRLKDGLTYKDAFDGREAVDKIAYIIKTTDRNLALLLGRALDAQKFFHDVTYDHRLRDSGNELYQFRTKLPSPFVSGELPNEEDAGSENGGLNGQGNRKHSSPDVSRSHVGTPPNSFSPDLDKADKDDVSQASPPPHTLPRKGSITSDEIPLPSGVFTLLTDCYSPTCSRDQLCYSIACPRRLEQQARLNMKPQPGLTKQISRESLGDVVVGLPSHPFVRTTV